MMHGVLQCERIARCRLNAAPGTQTATGRTPLRMDASSSREAHLGLFTRSGVRGNPFRDGVSWQPRKDESAMYMAGSVVTIVLARRSGRDALPANMVKAHQPYDGRTLSTSSAPRRDRHRMSQTNGRSPVGSAAQVAS